MNEESAKSLYPVDDLHHPHPPTTTRSSGFSIESILSSTTSSSSSSSCSPLMELSRLTIYPPDMTNGALSAPRGNLVSFSSSSSSSPGVDECHEDEENEQLDEENDRDTGLELTAGDVGSTTTKRTTSPNGKSPQLHPQNSFRILCLQF